MSNFTQQTNTDLAVMANLFLDALYPEVVALKRVTVGVPTIGGLNHGDEITIADLTISGAPAVRAINGSATISDLVTLTKSMPKQHIDWGFKVDNIEEFFQPDALPLRASASVQLAQGIAAMLDAMVLSNAAYQACYEVGKLDGTAVWNNTDIVKPINDAITKFKKNGVPIRDMHAAFGLNEGANLRSLSQLLKVNEAGSDQLLREGVVGSLMGFELIDSPNVLSTLTVSAAAATDTPAAVVGVNAQGGSTLAVNGLGTGTVKKGTIFTIAGFNNKVGYLQGFEVTADATIASNAATLSIFPKLPAATVGSEVVTFAEHSQPGSPNIAWTRDAIVAYLDAAPAFTDIPSQTVRDKDSGIAVRLSLQTDLATFSTKVVADVIFGTVVKRPEGVVRIWGQV